LTSLKYIYPEYEMTIDFILLIIEFKGEITTKIKKTIGKLGDYYGSVFNGAVYI